VKRAIVAIAITIAVSVSANGDTWWKHVQFLADDSMRGRDTGSPEHKRAAEYVAAEFRKSGLEPAGAGGFIQPVAFKTRRIDEAHSSLAIIRDGRTMALTLGEHANFSLRADPAPAVDAPLVFVGHGLNVPEQNINDLDGLNLKGAIAVYIGATPRSLPSVLQAHFGTAAERWRAFRAAGAVGTITIANPRNVETPWAQTTGSRLQPAMSLADPSLDDYAGQQVAITMNPAHANMLFEGSGHTFDEIIALENERKPLPRFALPARVSARVAVTRGQVESRNVAGILRGSDPARRDEYVVVSAYLDHVGVGAPVAGDASYNGAMDNASGIAAILDIAGRLHAAGERPSRSLLFLAVTGE